MKNINKVAVLGAGVMGSGIAAHMANAGLEVILLDMPAKEGERSQIAKSAIEKQLKAAPSGFTHPDNAKRVMAGNFDDDLAALAQCDWIIEVIVEKLEAKHALYHKIEAMRKPGSIISSNTSTLPLARLMEGMAPTFQRDFCITHFFNPPRLMPLLEMVCGAQTDGAMYDALAVFVEEKLGKGVVQCKDTPGFIANRIGVYWMMLALECAQKIGITVEQADAVMGKPAGIPKTGVFGLFDLIGIDLMPLIAQSMLHELPAHDAFRALPAEPPLLQRMIAQGLTGRKGKGGFTRIRKEGDKKIREVLDLSTEQYRTEQKVELASVAASKAGLRALVEHADKGGQFAWAVLSGTIVYAAELIPQIADDAASIDAAMKMGYSWKFGPFEMLDQLGAAWFAEKLRAENRAVPQVIDAIAALPGGKTYEHLPTSTKVFAIPSPREIKIAPNARMLADFTRGQAPLLQEKSGALWDLKDGIFCLELRSKMNAIDEDVLNFIQQALAHTKANAQGLVIGSDAEYFSVGANLAMIHALATAGDYSKISALIQHGHQTMLAIRYAPFPVVAAASGLALGGGCELMMHADAVQAHMEFYPGLVEVNVGLIPGWGGCKEMLRRHQANSPEKIAAVFHQIRSAKTATSAQDAVVLSFMQPQDRISMNRTHVLADAKTRAIALAKNYQIPAAPQFDLPGKAALSQVISTMQEQTAHDALISNVLANVLCGGDTGGALTERHLLTLEHDGFMELVRTPLTAARIDFMLNNGKPLRN